MTEHCALVVIGGGPGGMATATAAAKLGVQVLLIDEKQNLGGQIYSGINNLDDLGITLLGPDYARGTSLVQSFQASGATYRAESDVWIVTPELKVGVVSRGVAEIIQAQRVVLASGSMERAVPFPGWTLPGVMTLGAGQVLMKQEGLVPDVGNSKGIVLAGSGPLLFLVACQYLRAGVKIQALLEMTPRSRFLKALINLPMALTADGYIRTGLSLVRELRCSGVPIVSGVTKLAAVGTRRVKSVDYIAFDQRHSLDTELLMVHFGTIPNGYLAAELGIHEIWDGRQNCWRPSIDKWGNTDLKGLALVGDCAGIVGARSAELSGQLAALEVAAALGKISCTERDRLAKPLHLSLKRDLRIRPFLETLFAPPTSFMTNIPDDTVVCRCEEVNAGRLREAVELGCQGPNQVKAFTRAGMGLCQGLQCGFSVAQIVAEARGVAVETVGRFRVRPPVKPITLGAIAMLEDEFLE